MHKKCRSIPPNTYSSLARRKTYVPVVKREKVIPQLFQLAFTERLARLHLELDELTLFAQEGYNVGRLHTELQAQIQSLQQLLK